MSRTRRALKNSFWNLSGLILSTAVSLLLPPFIVHRLPPAEYAAWVLILQLSAYVNFLEFGVQTAVGKFVAEYDARSDREKCSRILGSAFLVLSAAAFLGLGVVAFLVYRVPLLFHQMPVSLQPQVRLGLVFVGTSICFMLPMSVFFAVFYGLQRFGFPTVILAVSKLLYTASLVGILLIHGSLSQMAMATASFNVFTSVAAAGGWFFLLRARVPLLPLRADTHTLRELLHYCGILGLWSAGMLLISGLDTTLVGHFDYPQTGFYAVAASASNFMLLIIGSLVAPLLPAASSLGTTQTPQHMGLVALRVNRMGVLLVLSIGLPLLVLGFPALHLWMGALYARNSLVYLRVLTTANVIRYLTYAYVVMVVGRGRQRAATLSPVCESILNLVLSVLLARHYGALGVALGTLIAACVGVSIHIAVSMKQTADVLQFTRRSMLRSGLARPLVAALPTLILFPFWRSPRLLPMSPPLLLLWLATTIGLMWMIGLGAEERRKLVAHSKLRFRTT